MRKVFFLLYLSFLFFFNGAQNNFRITPACDSLQLVTLAFVGDLMCHSTQFNYAKVGHDSFDFNPHFEFVKDYLSRADFTFGNLETVFGGRELGYIGYPNFNSPDDYASAIKNSGFDFLFTSNNHSLDQGERGVIRTLKILDELRFTHAGTYSSFAAGDSLTKLNIGGIEISTLSYTYGTNGKNIPKGKEYLVNLISLEKLKEDIAKAKQNKNSLILIYFHFGEEYQRTPNEYQKRIVDSAFSFGADIIIGSHPHVLQKCEFKKLSNSKFDTGFVAYSLGNFFSNQQWRYSNIGGILFIQIEKNITNNLSRISSSNFLPAYVFRGIINQQKTYRIIPLFEHEDLKSKYNFLSAEDIRLMNEAFDDTKKIINIPLYQPEISR